jgi:hypothetical protein
MEVFPRSPFEMGSDPDEPGKTKRKKRGSLRLPIAAVEGDDQPARTEQERPERSAERGRGMFAALIEREREREASKQREDAPGHGSTSPETSRETETAQAATDNTAGAQRNNEYTYVRAEDTLHEQPRAVHLAPNELSGGEVIIDLDRPVAERIIPLHGEQVTPVVESTPRAVTPTMERPVQSTEANLPAPVAEDLHVRQQVRSETGQTIPLEATQTLEVLPGSAAQAEQGVPVPGRAEAAAPPAEAAPDYEPPFIVPPAVREMAPSPVSVTPHEATVVHAAHMPPVPPAVIGAFAANAASMPGPEQLMSRSEITDAVQAASRQAGVRGLVTGLLAGGAYEHFKHRRREKRRDKHVRRQAKQLANARADYQFAASEQQRRQDRTEYRLRKTEARLQESEARSANVLQPASIPPRRFETQSGAQVPVGGGGERMPVTPVGHEAPQRQGSPRFEQVQPTDMRPEVPPDHYIETSAWLAMEKDAKTGKLVENPSFQYGHEYYSERAQEGVPITQRTVAAGGAALAAAATSERTGDKKAHTTGPAAELPAGAGSASASSVGGGGGSVPTSGSTMTMPIPTIPSASTQGPPSAIHASQSANDDQNRPLQSESMSEQPLWPWVVALVVVVVALIAVLA